MPELLPPARPAGCQVFQFAPVLQVIPASVPPWQQPRCGPCHPHRRASRTYLVVPFFDLGTDRAGAVAGNGELSGEAVGAVAGNGKVTGKVAGGAAGQVARIGVGTRTRKSAVSSEARVYDDGAGSAVAGAGVGEAVGEDISASACVADRVNEVAVAVDDAGQILRIGEVTGEGLGVVADEAEIALEGKAMLVVEVGGKAEGEKAAAVEAADQITGEFTGGLGRQLGHAGPPAGRDRRAGIPVMGALAWSRACRARRAPAWLSL